ncbi:MAG: hypothetical protein IPH39_04175 [Sulfuritalea sp.]|nr:hypothetical protein [Sulfuritalea sp.]
MSRASSNIDPELLQLLGTVVVKWSYVELFVSDLFVYLSRGAPHAMVVVTANASQSSLASWIRTLLDLLECPHDWEKEIREVLAEIDDMRPERNAFVHGNWIAGDGPGAATIHTIRLERKEVIKTELVTASDLKAFLDRIQDQTLRLRAILVTCGVWKPEHDANAP